ncbi:uncharacterized protein CIMG_05939 [Coccidioides immitis RS]|uniref:Uncharacterized protein n=1 Tax=Coccidioides immitis (strain RS) TaxID=246410 RepID=A0A0E1RVQ6_COCIM|nr:uncharacterized protein CIMG_05939 [Coccidioides immitis RS]EAS30460.1 hypothetical protein CIMG_05939 [Coccidioides immitis RS]
MNKDRKVKMWLSKKILCIVTRAFVKNLGMEPQAQGKENPHDDIQSHDLNFLPGGGLRYGGLVIAAQPLHKHHAFLQKFQSATLEMLTADELTWFLDIWYLMRVLIVLVLQTTTNAYE